MDDTGAARDTSRRRRLAMSTNPLIPLAPGDAPEPGPQSAATNAPPPPVLRRRPSLKPAAATTGWPLSRGAEALQMVARRSGFPLAGHPVPALPAGIASDP